MFALEMGDKIIRISVKNNAAYRPTPAVKAYTCNTGLHLQYRPTSAVKTYTCSIGTPLATDTKSANYSSRKREGMSLSTDVIRYCISAWISLKDAAKSDLTNFQRELINGARFSGASVTETAKILVCASSTASAIMIAYTKDVRWCFQIRTVDKRQR